MHDLVDPHPSKTKTIQIVVSGNRRTADFELHDGESALVGQAFGCQLRIEDNAVAPHQCLLEQRDGTLMLHNWSEDDSTTVNGSVVHEEVTLVSTDDVRFGNYRIQFQMDASNEDPVASTGLAEISNVPRVESVEDSTIAVLHSEIAYLQRELEQRDAQLLQSESTTAVPQEPDDALPASNRVSDLMDELEVADARLLNLTDELRLVEEIRTAENEERNQLTIWVNEIETMIAKREGEQFAEMEALRTRLEHEQTERLLQQERADDIARGEAAESHHDTLRQLRSEHESLRTQFDEITDQARKTQQECEMLRAASTDAAIEKRIHEAIRVERLEVAKDRADISRREHDLSNKLRELNIQVDSKPSPQDVDAKSQDFQEQPDDLQGHEPQQDACSMGQRLVSLWQSLDDATDRD